MNKPFGAALLLGAMMLGGLLCVGAQPAIAASFAQTDIVSRVDRASSTDLSARRRGHRAAHHYFRRHHRVARSYYYGRPRYYRPSPGLPPFFPFGLGYGLPPS